MRLAGKTAVITGASNGIGRALAIGFARQGAALVCADIREEPHPAADSKVPTADLIRAEGGRAHFQSADVSDPEQVTQLFGFALDTHNRLDIVVNNAGLLESSSVLDTSDGDWDRVMAVNLRGQFLVARAAIAQMLTQQPRAEVRGRVINISSIYGLIGAAEFFAYSVAKGGMVNMTRQLAVDYGRHGILVNGIAPGRIVTRPDDRSEDPTNVSAEIVHARARTPFPRFGRPADLVGPALFLASDDCTFVSGHTLVVDGGWMAS